MKFRFPLQKVLEHRKILEGLAQKEFQEAINNLNQENAKMAQMQKQQSEAHSQVQVYTRIGGAQAASLNQIHDFLRGHKILIERQKKKIQDAEKLVESKREILREAAKEYKIIERMREKKLEDFRVTQIHEDQKEMDEQSILRFKGMKES